MKQPTSMEKSYSALKDQAALLQFVREKDRERLIEAGGKECKICHTLFVPHNEKSWTGSGYCSKLCASKDNALERPVAFQDSDGVLAQAEASNKVNVTCENGHEFGLLKSFSGMKRKCPQCGSKTDVP